MHRPTAKCIPYRVSFFMQPSKEAGASTTSFGDGRDHGWGLHALFRVTQSRWHCKDLSRAFQILFFLLLVPGHSFQAHNPSEAFVGEKESIPRFGLTCKSVGKVPTGKEGASGTNTDLSSAPFRIQTQPLTQGSHRSS